MCLKDSNVFDEKSRGIIVKNYSYNNNVIFFVPNLDKCMLHIGGRSKIVGFCIKVADFAHIDTSIKDSYIRDNLRIIGYNDKVSSVVNGDGNCIIMINIVNHEDPIYRFRTSMISKLGSLSYNLDWLFDRINSVLEDLAN